MGNACALGRLQRSVISRAVNFCAGNRFRSIFRYLRGLLHNHVGYLVLAQPLDKATSDSANDIGAGRHNDAADPFPDNFTRQIFHGFQEHRLRKVFLALKIDPERLALLPDAHAKRGGRRDDHLPIDLFNVRLEAARDSHLLSDFPTVNHVGCGLIYFCG